MERKIEMISMDDLHSSARAHWLSRTPEERVAEVERLRAIYISAILGKRGAPKGLRRVLRVVEPTWR